MRLAGIRQLSAWWFQAVAPTGQLVREQWDLRFQAARIELENLCLGRRLRCPERGVLGIGEVRIDRVCSGTPNLS